MPVAEARPAAAPGRAGDARLSGDVLAGTGDHRIVILHASRTARHVPIPLLPHANRTEN